MTNQRRTAMLSSYLKKILFINCLIIAQAHAIDKLRLEQRNGLFSGIEDSVPVVTAQYIAWDANWKWAGVNIAREALAKDNNANLVYHGKVAALDTDFTATIKVDGGQIQWDYAFDNKKDHPEAIGFGIEFNLIINSATFKTPAQAPEPDLSKAIIRPEDLPSGFLHTGKMPFCSIQINQKELFSA